MNQGMLTNKPRWRLSFLPILAQAPLEIYCISKNECDDFTVVLKLETVILLEL